jgi:hypothetical protein
MKKDIKKEVLEKIAKKEVAVRPKTFFAVLNAILAIILISIGAVAVYLWNLSFYLPRRGLTPEEMMDRPIVLASIPWGLVILGASLVVLLSYLYIKHEGGYKKNILWTIVGISILLIFGGAAISATRLNEALERRPMMGRFYENTEYNFAPGKAEKRRLRRLEREHLPFNLEMMKDYN